MVADVFTSARKTLRSGNEMCLFAFSLCCNII